MSGGEREEKQWKCGKAIAVANLQRVGTMVRDIGEPCLSRRYLSHRHGEKRTCISLSMQISSFPLLPSFGTIICCILIKKMLYLSAY
jgi:hypothetical protein